MFTKGAIEHMRREAVTDRRFQLDRLELAALAKMEGKDEAFKLAFDYGRGMERRLSKTRPYFPITAQQFMAYQKYLLRRDLTPAERELYEEIIPQYNQLYKDGQTWRVDRIAVCIKDFQDRAASMPEIQQLMDAHCYWLIAAWVSGVVAAKKERERGM